MANRKGRIPKKLSRKPAVELSPGRFSKDSTFTTPSNDSVISLDTSQMDSLHDSIVNSPSPKSRRKPEVQSDNMETPTKRSSSRRQGLTLKLQQAQETKSVVRKSTRKRRIDDEPTALNHHGTPTTQLKFEQKEDSKEQSKPDLITSQTYKPTRTTKRQLRSSGLEVVVPSTPANINNNDSRKNPEPLQQSFDPKPSNGRKLRSIEILSDSKSQNILETQNSQETTRKSSSKRSPTKKEIRLDIQNKSELSLSSYARTKTELSPENLEHFNMAHQVQETEINRRQELTQTSVISPSSSDASYYSASSRLDDENELKRENALYRSSANKLQPPVNAHIPNPQRAKQRSNQPTDSTSTRRILRSTSSTFDMISLSDSESTSTSSKVPSPGPLSANSIPEKKKRGRPRSLVPSQKPNQVRNSTPTPETSLQSPDSKLNLSQGRARQASNSTSAASSNSPDIILNSQKRRCIKSKVIQKSESINPPIKTSTVLKPETSPTPNRKGAKSRIQNPPTRNVNSSNSFKKQQLKPPTSIGSVNGKRRLRSSSPITIGDSDSNRSSLLKSGVTITSNPLAFSPSHKECKPENGRSITLGYQQASRPSTPLSRSPSFDPGMFICADDDVSFAKSEDNNSNKRKSLQSRIFESKSALEKKDDMDEVFIPKLSSDSLNDSNYFIETESRRLSQIKREIPKLPPRVKPDHRRVPQPQVVKTASKADELNELFNELEARPARKAATFKIEENAANMALESKSVNELILDEIKSKINNDAIALSNRTPSKDNDADIFIDDLMEPRKSPIPEQQFVVNDSLELMIADDENIAPVSSLVVSEPVARKKSRSVPSRENSMETSRMDNTNKDRLNYFVERITSKDASISSKRSSLVELNIKLIRDEQFARSVYSSGGLPLKVVEKMLFEKPDLIISTCLFQIFGHLLELEVEDLKNGSDKEIVSRRLIKFITGGNSLLISNFRSIMTDSIGESDINLTKLRLSKIEKETIRDWMKVNDEEPLKPAYEVAKFLVLLFKLTKSTDDSSQLAKAIFDSEFIERMLKITPTEETDNLSKDVSLILINVLETLINYNINLAMEFKELLSKTMKELNTKILSYSLHNFEYISSILKTNIVLSSALLISERDQIDANRRGTEEDDCSIFDESSKQLEDAVFSLELAKPLLDVIDDSTILSSKTGSDTDLKVQEISLFALGYLLNIVDFALLSAKPGKNEIIDDSSEAKFLRLLNNLKEEKSANDINRVHSIGYYCFIVGQISPFLKRKLNYAQRKRIFRGLSTFDEVMTEESALKIKVEKMITEFEPRR